MFRLTNRSRYCRQSLEGCFTKIQRAAFTFCLTVPSFISTVSESNRYFAWVSDSDSREASIMDLETSEVRKIHVKEGKSIRVLGFLQEDLVYGIAADKHQIKGPAGIGQDPMYELRIADASSMEVLKKYRKKGYFIDGVEFHDGVLVIQRRKSSIRP